MPRHLHLTIRAVCFANIKDIVDLVKGTIAQYEGAEMAERAVACKTMLTLENRRSASQKPLQSVKTIE